MQPGETLKLKTTVRSQKTGLILPREGTLVQITKNLGRTLLLVAFDNGSLEYLFEREVECKSNHKIECNRKFAR